MYWPAGHPEARAGWEDRAFSSLSVFYTWWCLPAATLLDWSMDNLLSRGLCWESSVVVPPNRILTTRTGHEPREVYRSKMCFSTGKTSREAARQRRQYSTIRCAYRNGSEVHKPGNRRSILTSAREYNVLPQDAHGFVKYLQSFRPQSFTRVVFLDKHQLTTTSLFLFCHFARPRQCN